jgi:hypothetical protein
MKQGQLFKPQRRMETISKKRDQYDEANERSAQYIIDHPDEFGGQASGPVIVARMTLARLAREQQVHQ